MNHPPMNASIEDWVAWVEVQFPFNLRDQWRLAHRLESDRPAVGSQLELEDLRGVADPINLSKRGEPRTRVVAATMARVWFQMREQERRQHWRGAGIDGRTAERELADVDAAIGGAK